MEDIEEEILKDKNAKNEIAKNLHHLTVYMEGVGYYDDLIITKDRNGNFFALALVNPDEVEPRDIICDICGAVFSSFTDAVVHLYEHIKKKEI